MASIGDDADAMRHDLTRRHVASVSVREAVKGVAPVNERDPVPHGWRPTCRPLGCGSSRDAFVEEGGAAFSGQGVDLVFQSVDLLHP
jgi:hypothetical protein